MHSFPAERSDKGLCWRENRHKTSAKTSVCRPHRALTPRPAVSPRYHSSNDTSQWSCTAESQGQPGLCWGLLSWAALLNTVVLVSAPRTVALLHIHAWMSAPWTATNTCFRLTWCYSHQLRLKYSTTLNQISFKGVIWCDFKFCFLFGVLQADCA